jgi:ubiquinone/menaquinone biosynthesis C-methylase UbiE
MTVSKTTATRREWEDLAHVDPLWAILARKKKRFGRWEPEEFFASGQQEIDGLMSSCGLTAGDNGKVLDFGCGVGRLSRALRPYFAEVYGVDISEEMIRLARSHVESCTFLLNQRDDLRLFEDNSFDFIYSNIVLQHQASKDVAKFYIAEFVRVIKPGGMIVFQMPYKLGLADRLQPKRRIYALLKLFGFSAEFLYRELRLNPMRTISLASAEVNKAIVAAGGHLERSYRDSWHRYSMSYLVRKSVN